MMRVHTTTTEPAVCRRRIAVTWETKNYENTIAVASRLYGNSNNGSGTSTASRKERMQNR